MRMRTTAAVERPTLRRWARRRLAAAHRHAGARSRSPAAAAARAGPPGPPSATTPARPRRCRSGSRGCPAASRRARRLDHRVGGAGVDRSRVGPPATRASGVSGVSSAGGVPGDVPALRARGVRRDDLSSATVPSPTCPTCDDLSSMAGALVSAREPRTAGTRAAGAGAQRHAAEPVRCDARATPPASPLACPPGSPMPNRPAAGPVVLAPSDPRKPPLWLPRALVMAAVAVFLGRGRLEGARPARQRHLHRRHLVVPRRWRWSR